MKSIKSSLLVYLSLFALLIPNTSHAHLENLSFQELVRRSTYIFVGEVMKTRKRWDGSMLADVRVELPIKGASAGNMLVAYGQAYNKAKEDLTELNLRRHYIFYIIDVNDGFYLLGVRGKDYYLINNNNVTCDDKQTTLEDCVERIRKDM